MNNDESVSRLMRKHRDELTYELPRALEERLAPRRRYPMPRIASLAAACVVIAFLSFQWGRNTGIAEDSYVQEVVSGHVRSLMANHLADVASTDRHTVKPWFEGKLDFGPDVRDFAAEGFPLTGGRLDYIGSRAVAGLVYKHGQHVINLFEWPSTAADESVPKLRTSRGFQLFHWRRSGLEYWLVSDVNAADLQKFTELLSRSP